MQVWLKSKIMAVVTWQECIKVKIITKARSSLREKSRSRFASARYSKRAIAASFSGNQKTSLSPGLLPRHDFLLTMYLNMLDLQSRGEMYSIRYWKFRIV